MDDRARDFERGIEDRPVDERALILAYLMMQIGACVPAGPRLLDEARERLRVLEYMTRARYVIPWTAPDDPSACSPGDDDGATSAWGFLMDVLDEIDSVGDAFKPDSEEAYRRAFDRIAQLCELAEPLRQRAYEARFSCAPDDKRWKIVDTAFSVAQEDAAARV